MESTLDKTALSTISLLEARLLRVEHLLYGPTSTSRTLEQSCASGITDLEKRFAKLTSDIRVYAELLKIYKMHPTLFHPPEPSQPPTQLSKDALTATVFASAASFQSTASSLTAIKDCPVPEPSESAALIAAAGRMRAIEATQLAQAGEMADLRARSERALRHWYEFGVVGASQVVADVEGRMEDVEKAVRRREREAREDES